jgi:hypothetical protein
MNPAGEDGLPRTLIDIERNSAEPLYRQVRRAIEHGIALLGQSCAEVMSRATK